MKALPYGSQAVLVELEDPSAVVAVAAALAEDHDVAEAVPAARTVLAVLRTAVASKVAGRLVDLAQSAALHAAAASRSDEVVLDVVYDGADLAATAAELDLDTDGLVRAHVAGAYVVAFCGFAPGFAYLTGLDPALHVPRLPEPRTRVPPGSVAIAGEFTGVYPHASPGGWRLLGRTSARLWDPDRDPPALLAPGVRVRFQAART